MPTALRRLFASFGARALPVPGLALVICSLALLGACVPAVAQDTSPLRPAPASDAAPVVHPTSAGLPPGLVTTDLPASSPRFLFKSGLRLTHLFYLPDRFSWQLVLPMSFGLEYRLNPSFSVFAQAEADVAAGRPPRGRRGGMAPSSGASLGLGARCYFNQTRSRCIGAPAECWGNYLALETNTDLSAAGRLRGGRGQSRNSRSLTRFTPSLFALVGTQHAGPGHRLLYDLNAGLGLEAPPPYTAEGGGGLSWNVVAQMNLRVYLVNHRKAGR